MADPVFHITVDGPTGMIFKSFPSVDLEKGDPAKILLSMIRSTCCISNKLFFTIDGKSRIDDETSLAYYMSLTSEELMTSLDQEKITKVMRRTTAKLYANINILTVKVSDGKIASSPLALPANKDAMSRILDGIKGTKLKQGNLPTFTDQELSSLKTNFAVTAGPGGIPEPSDMTEMQWHKVFTNNRALHGYVYDFENNIMVKARKRAFNLKSTAPVGDPPANGGRESSSKGLPPLPPFYITDDASVSVTEIRGQFQQTLSKQGFNYRTICGSIAGGTSIPATISASFEEEHSFSNQARKSSDVTSLAVTYNFPRVTVELDQDCLELTEECRRDAMAISDSKSKDRFLRDYGSVFVSQFTLGGFLHSTRNLSSNEVSHLNQIKDRTRIAAGFSFQSPNVTGSINVAKGDEKSEDNGSASLHRDVRLTWDAHGGDTLLCSNPSAWASTVKNYQLWRLMNQQRLVKMEGLIHVLDVLAYRKLENPSSDISIRTDDVRDAVIRDPVANERARVNLVDAFISGQPNVLATKIQKLYEDGNYEVGANINPFNNLFRENFPDGKDSLIEDGTVWGQLTIDQRVAFGLYLASLGQIQVI